MHNFWSGFKYFGAGALGAEAGLYLGPEVGFAVGGTLNVLADYSEGHIKGATLGQTILNSAFSFVSGGGSAYMGAEAGIVKAQQILFNRALKTATATTLTAAQSIQPLDGQVGFQQTTTDAEVPQQVAGPESNLYSIGTGDAGFFENPNGGAEPTLSFDVETSATKTGSTTLTKFYPENNGFLGTPERTTLMPEEQISRYGRTSGKFFSPDGTPLPMRALPPG